MQSSSLLPAQLTADHALVARTLRSHPLLRYAPAVLHGVEHLPRAGGALLVGNHGPVAMDTALLVHAVHREALQQEVKSALEQLLEQGLSERSARRKRRTPE